MWKKYIKVFSVFVLTVAATPQTRTHATKRRSIDRASFVMSLQRLTALRALMTTQPTALAAYIIPTADAHNSEYIAPADARREWISGFTGSAGTAVVTLSQALVWTDGRYYTQFEKEADLSLWTLMKQSLPDTPSLEKWLASNLCEGEAVGIDPHTFTREEWTPLQTALNRSSIQLIPVENNLVDEVRVSLNDPPPKRPNNTIIPLPVKYTGKKAGQKVEELRKKMAEKKASALVITALDEVAYTLNLRGSDIQYNPVFFSYLIITDASVILFTGSELSKQVLKHFNEEDVQVERRPYEDIVWYLREMATEENWITVKEAVKMGSKLLKLVTPRQVFFSYLIITDASVILFTGSELSEQVLKHFNEEDVQVERRPYEDIVWYLREMAKELKPSDNRRLYIWLSNVASEAIHRAAVGPEDMKSQVSVISEVSPVALMKLVKNEVELQGFRNCHIRDGIAVCRLFKWLHEKIDKGDIVTEIQAADKLLEFRKDEADFMGPSFETIPGAGANGAIIHYSPSREGVQKVIEIQDMFLLDSGGQYKDGTTDITRTRHMSCSPRDDQRAAFTRVLKGQIMMGSALFPQGVKGNVLDSFARHSLWEVGLDYAHGTGHGVGHFLNVHEGPSGVSWRPYPHDPGLKPGIVLSNEPGFYKVGDYGIRHEDLVEVIKVTNDTKHPKAAGLVGDYDGRGVLGFNTLTLVPNQKECIDTTLLTDFELNYINAYHKRVLDTLGPIMRQRALHEDLKWLQQECEPIVRDR